MSFPRRTFMMISKVLFLFYVLVNSLNYVDSSGLNKYFKNSYDLYVKREGSNLTVQDDLSTKLFQFMTGGLSDLIWSHMLHNTLKNEQMKLNPSCKESLEFVIKGLDKGYMTAFEVIDSTSKKPIGLIDGTLSFWGDFDQCLAIKGTKFDGRYCAVNVMPRTYHHLQSELNPEILHLDEPPLNHMGYFFGICFPSKCSKEDIETVITNSLKGYPLELQLLSCETAAEISYWNRLANAGWFQLFSLLIFFGLTNQLLWTTIYDCLVRYRIKSPSIYIEQYLQPIIDIFSGRKNFVRIFYVKQNESSSFFDYFKLWILFMSIAGNILYCLDSPFGTYLIGHHQLILNEIPNFFSQPFFNETRVCLMNFFAGLITFTVTSEMIKKGKLNFATAILDRYMRHAPSIFGLLVLEFVWPLLFSGPLYTLQGEYALSKCYRMWLRNLLLIGNLGWTNGFETCISHTYYSAVDFQLFIAGLVVVNLLIKEPQKGLMATISLIIIGNLTMASTLYFRELDPVLITNQMDPIKMSKYLDAFHFSTSSYLSPYFMGVLIAFLTKKGLRLDVSSGSSKWFWILTGIVMFMSAEFCSSLYNTFEVVPSFLSPLYVLLPRLLYVGAASIFVLYTQSLPSKEEKKNEEIRVFHPTVKPGTPTGQVLEVPSATPVPSNIDNGSHKKMDTENFRIDVIKGLSRIAFSSYIVSIWQIKLDFYTSTQVFENSAYPFIKRLMYMTFFVLQSGFFFQLLFISPVDNVRHVVKRGFGALTEMFPGENKKRLEEAEKIHNKKDN